MINLLLDASAIAVGGTLSGYCLWTPDAPQDQQPPTLKVGWRTAGQAEPEAEVIYQAALLPAEELRFVCQIPPIGPVSYDGCLLKIIWEVSVQRFQLVEGRLEQDVQRFRVLPREL